jgi:hypothetical protein
LFREPAEDASAAPAIAAESADGDAAAFAGASAPDDVVGTEPERDALADVGGGLLLVAAAALSAARVSFTSSTVHAPASIATAANLIASRSTCRISPSPLVEERRDGQMLCG